MLRWTTRLTAIACTMCVAIACSQSGSQTAAAASERSADASSGRRADTAGATPLACNKVFSPADVEGLLKSPVTVSQVPGGVAWCAFLNDFSGDITVSSGSDQSNEMLWNDATESSNSKNFVPFPGVGDKAVFEAGTDAINPVLASQKGKVYCNVAYDRGTSDHYKKFQSVGAAEIGKKLGALCNKAFAAVGA